MSERIFEQSNGCCVGTGSTASVSDPHLALVYGSKREQFATVAPFIRTGIEQNERCLYCYDDNSREELLAALSGGGVPVEQALADGRLTVKPAEAVFREGGAFDRASMVETLAELVAETKASDEFDRLRVTAENTWLTDCDTPVEEFFEYEAEANHVVDHESFVGLCQFSRDQLDEDELGDVLRTHPRVAFDGRCSYNDHYESPGEFRPGSADIDAANSLQSLRRQTDLARDASKYRTVATGFADVPGSLGTSSEQTVAETTAQTFRKALDAAVAGLWLYDSTTAGLELAATTTRPSVQREGESLLRPSSDQAWRAFSDNQAQFRTVDGDTDSPVDTVLAVPVEDHGVLCAGTTGMRSDDRLADVARAASKQAAMALDGVKRERALQDRERTIEERTASLSRLTEITETVRRVATGLVEAPTVEAASERACAELVDDTLFRFAWVGECDRVSDVVEPTAWAGTGRGYLDTVSLQTESSQSEPGVVAARDRQLSTTTDVAAQLHEEEWRREAFARDFRGVVAVPLVYEGVQYGVLAAYTDSSDTLEDPVPTVVSELGDLVAYAFNAIERKQSLLTDRAIQLTFEFRDSRSPTLRLAREAGCELDLEATVPKSRQRTLGFFAVPAGDVDALTDAAEDAVAVLDHCVVEADADGGLVQLELQRPFLATVLADHGVVLRSLTVDESLGRATVEFPDSIDVRSVVRAMSNTIPDAELVSKQSGSPPTGTGSDQRGATDALTDRQFEILQTAYHAGYFEEPRQSDGQAIADMLDITPPTFHQHRRVAINGILQSLLDD